MTDCPDCCASVADHPDGLVRLSGLKPWSRRSFYFVYTHSSFFFEDWICRFRFKSCPLLRCSHSLATTTWEGWKRDRFTVRFIEASQTASRPRIPSLRLQILLSLSQIIQSWGEGPLAGNYPWKYAESLFLLFLIIHKTKMSHPWTTSEKMFFPVTYHN